MSCLFFLWSVVWLWPTYLLVFFLINCKALIAGTRLRMKLAYQVSNVAPGWFMYLTSSPNSATDHYLQFRFCIHDAFLLLGLTLINFYIHTCFSSPTVFPPSLLLLLLAFLSSSLLTSMSEVENDMKNYFQVISSWAAHRKRKLQEIE